MSAAKDTFLYFGYGSNLLRQRILLQNPSAVFDTIARLDNYKLDFNYPSKTWNGAAATIIESQGDHVWGAVWCINISDMPNLDKQEGVESGIYEPIQVQVVVRELNEHVESVECRSYRLLKTDHEDHRPSPQYLDVIVRGAVDIGLPVKYIEALRKIEHNGKFRESVEVYDKMNLSKDSAEIKGF
jgi:gamma-glutamylcyclotransferase